MLVKIKAIIADEGSSKEQDLFINPDYIQNASVAKESSCLELRMSDGTRYLILQPYWILEASQSSHVMKTLYGLQLGAVRQSALLLPEMFCQFARCPAACAGIRKEDQRPLS